MSNPMRLIGIHNVQIDETEYQVSLYDISVVVHVFKKRDKLVYTQELKTGSAKFRAAIKAMKTNAAPGSLAAEQIAQCDSNFVKR